MSVDTSDEYVVRELAGIRDALAKLAAVAQQSTPPQSSVEISRNSKGATWSVKVYATDPSDASTLAQGLYDQLAERFGQPASDGVA